MFETMVLMYKNEGGILALYRGILPTVAGVAPYVSLGIQPVQRVHYVDRSETGGIEFYGVRVGSYLPYTCRRKESQPGEKTACWGLFRGSCPNMHLSFVSHEMS